MRKVAIAFGLLLALACAGAAAGSQEQERTFADGYAGSLPGDPALLARNYFDDPGVRALIYDLEDGPVGRARVDAAIAGTDFTVDDLLRTKILRERDGLYSIAFNYFTADDMRAIYAVADARIPSLVAAYMERRDDIYASLARYPAKSVPADLLAYVLIAGFSLNWDGLQITEDRGWRAPDFVKGRNTAGTEWQYSYWASEIVPEHSVHRYFWGSSTFPGGVFNYDRDPVDFSYSSYGDPYSDPRMSFPDLLFLSGEEMAEPVRAIAARIGLADRTELDMQVSDTLGAELGRSVAAILFALRQRPLTEEQLRGLVLPEHAGALPDVLALLEETQYIERADGRYRLHFPVLDSEDAALVDEVMTTSREILEVWLEDNYDAVRSDLNDLTALRQGVPFESLFTQIWHDFFGLATRELVDAGFMADPYGADVRYPGALPVLWRMSLYDLEFG